MSLGDDLDRFYETLLQRERDVFVGVVGDVKGSIQEGSAVTGAPGQPVDTGNLRVSYQETYPEEWLGQVATAAEYAESIEEGQQPPYVREDGTQVTPRPMELRSEVGGFHSVRLTRTGFQRLVDAVVRKVVPQ